MILRGTVAMRTLIVRYRFCRGFRVKDGRLEMTAGADRLRLTPAFPFVAQKSSTLRPEQTRPFAHLLFWI
jgi:hypothetical protein